MKPAPWNPKGGTAIGRVSNRLALDRYNVSQDYTQERDATNDFQMDMSQDGIEWQNLMEGRYQRTG